MTDSGAAAPGAGVSRVQEYYRLVDADDVPGLIALFTEDAVYRRPGYEPMRGHDGLRAFYSGERVIKSGRHTVTTVVADGDRIAVNGTFEGVLKDGREVSLEFADFFVLDGEHRFTRRDTYFFAPLV
ncbi:nuclear transport factor 2 family protein [Streptomyces sp. MST-110588]|uniref:nuclear transport factor 2 family protein n=1 Tax=Streptomyces sp. MST-110588 TaxID=2833628 RepID=UPI001F5C21A0|nr:nuclear transport factor 2 family protein [Streptomyces sp. MST-110588]UNO41480.1 nuclear transport factor 2 family protein [Streptomyces sp. MST-110588]